MQKHKIHILSTRTTDAAIAKKAADANIIIDSFSFINVQFNRSDALVNKIQSLATKPLFAVFTSANAIDAVAEHVVAATGWKIFCTGGKTKELAAQLFGEKAIVGSAKSAAQLAERITGSGYTNRVTFFCGDQRLNELPETLKNGGIQTEEITVYTTELTPVLIEESYDGILFFSPSAVHSFFSMNTIAMNVVLFSIGHTTTDTIHSYCTNKIITSEWPGTSNLLTCVTDFYNKTKAEETIS